MARVTWVCTFICESVSVFCYITSRSFSLKAANAVENIADAVVHTKFIGGKSAGSDECVLYKILHVSISFLLIKPYQLILVRIKALLNF